tara:strand:- start:4837 stop:5421 length:585 start_codon:yes stop_codon:yes gene_type:complete
MITVIIPYKEARETLTEALASVAAQTSSYEILQGGGELLGKNVNKLVKQAKGDYIKILADDDTLTPHALLTLEKAIGNYDFVCGDAMNQVNGDNFSKHHSLVVTLDQMLNRNSIHGGTPLYRKDLWERFGGWDEELTTGEEYDWHLKLLKGGCKYTCIRSVVYNYRIWDGSKSQHLNNDETRKAYIEMIKDRYR